MLESRRRQLITGSMRKAKDLAQAKFNLSYARIIAPVDGMNGERAAEADNDVSPGTALMVVVLGETYIEADYREVELAHMLPGQPVRIHVDAYDADFDGIVDSVPPRNRRSVRVGGAGECDG